MKPPLLSLHQETQLQYLRGVVRDCPAGSEYGQKHEEVRQAVCRERQIRTQQNHLEAGLEGNKHVLSGLWV